MPTNQTSNFICDSHFHFGKFYEKYFSANFIADFIDKVKIDKIAISSTSICDENYEGVIGEFNQLLKISGDRIVPILWITPDMLDSNNLNTFLQSNISWKLIKIHGYIHKWPVKSRQISQVISIAKELSIPILFHTGGLKRCNAGSYGYLISKHPDLIFILAHGRPFTETLSVMRKFHNAWVDTAFMPIEDIIELIRNGFENRILYGSDYPITELYKETEEEDSEYYLRRIIEIRNQLNKKQQEELFCLNFQKLFCT